jgi:N-acetylmuramoyl-L-alanine amidase
MKWLIKLRNWLSPKPTPQNPPNVLPPEAPRPSQGGDREGVVYQRVTERPISRGRAMTPRAIVIHCTAGWQNQRPRDAISFMQSQGHGYLFMDEVGGIWQNIMLDESYAHAGTSKMPDFCHGMAGRTGVSGYGIGIEVACGDRLGANDMTWFNKKVHNARQAEFAVHGINGRFEPMTEAQEKALEDLCVDLCLRFSTIHPSCIVGHHEISPGRKSDPGGSLSMGMARFRARVADRVSVEKQS